MIKTIAILGSTGSIGENLLKIIKKDKKNFRIILLSANSNYLKLFKQAKEFNVKNLIIKDKKGFKILQKKTKNLNIKIFNDHDHFNKIFNQRIDYVMNSIVGLEGLSPTMKIIKYTKKIVIANKESIICGWNLIKKEIKKYKTEFIPVDSEHFSIWYALKSISNSNVKKIYLTASGGPLLNIPKFKFNKFKISEILNHPTWMMGKKISVDSATLMNKVLEILEAKKIFDIDIKKLNILIHPKSYLHAIIEFNDGMIKLIAHDTTMQIPIFNSIYNKGEKQYSSKKLNIKLLNNLDLKKISDKKFPVVKILKKIPENDSLFETIIVSANDELVNLYLKGKIKFTDISHILMKLLSDKKFTMFKRKTPKNVNQIIKINNYVRSKINLKSI